jgi:hypothetical protein
VGFKLFPRTPVYLIRHHNDNERFQKYGVNSSFGNPQQKIRDSVEGRSKEMPKFFFVVTILAISLTGAGQAFGQSSFFCGHKEPTTDYPGDYMSSTSADPCGSGRAVNLTIRQDSNPLLLVNTSLRDEIASQAVVPPRFFWIRFSQKEVFRRLHSPTIPDLVTSNTFTSRGSQG